MTVDVFALNFLYSLLATILGGVILALLFFWTRERFFPLPKIDGRWYFEVKTVSSAYNPYKGMILHYIAMVWRQDNCITGTFEKIYEKSSTGERHFDGVNRTRGIINGFIEKKYFSKDRIVLHIVEDGHGRESTHFYDLKVKSSHELEGKFESMVANQTGDVRCQRGEL